MRTTRWAGALLLLLLQASLLQACQLAGAALEPSLDDYDRTCSTDDDCVVVNSVCGCSCPTGALSRGGAQEYRADADATICPPSTIQCECISLEPVCNQGTCDVCETTESGSDLAPCASGDAGVDDGGASG